MTFKGKSLISITDFSKQEYLKILELAKEFEQNSTQDLLSDYVVAMLFFEPSTRTRLSFESAVLRLNGKSTGFSDAGTSSVKKGESLHDTIKTVESYCDLIVMRHPIDGSSRYASEISKVPVVNAGDGANQHPTQTLLDLYSIQKTQGKLDGLKVTFVGDLKHGRTVHSLVQALSLFECEFYFVSPNELKMPRKFIYDLEQKGIKYVEVEDLESFVKDSDVVYMTRIQKERFSDEMEYEKVKNSYVFKSKMLENTKDNLKVMHPLPRVNEIDVGVDKSEKAYYFEQAQNGVYVRQAIVSLILGVRE
jgi:aspartate carbamoyltransferase catalytic subunit